MNADGSAAASNNEGYRTVRSSFETRAKFGEVAGAASDPEARGEALARELLGRGARELLPRAS